MILTKNLVYALAMGVIPNVFASPINLDNGLQARDVPAPISVPFKTGRHYFLYVELLAGSQKSPVHIIWDTGSYQTWFPNSNVTCDEGAADCKDGGTFNPLDSTTYVDLGEPWGGSYLGGGAQSGWLGKDQVSIGGVTVEDLEFAVTDKAFFQGILGMALNNQSDPEYLPNKLKAQGHINRAAFSYWHDDQVGFTGSFLLGGLDKAKYDGDLVSVPRMIYEGGMKIPINTLVVDGVSFNTQGAPATVDTGSPNVTVPKAVVENITTTLGGSIDSWDGAHYFVDCKQEGKNLEFVFGEEKATVTVPVSEFIGEPWGPAHGLCPINIHVDDYYLIGVQVQKYAYWVFDQDKDTISVGKPTYSSNSEIVSF